MVRACVVGGRSATRRHLRMSTMMTALMVQAALVLFVLVKVRRRSAQAAIEGGETMNRAVLASLPGHIAILDRDGILLQSNRRWSRPGVPRAMLRLAEVELGQSYIDALREVAAAGDVGASLAIERVAAILAGCHTDGSVEDRCPLGDRWLEIRATALTRPEGGAIAVYLDITERARAAVGASSVRDDLTHLHRAAAMGELAASIVHELNQPLAAILTNAEAAQWVLDREPIDRQMLHDMLRDVIADDSRAAEVIRRMRTLLRRGEVRSSTHDLNDLAGEVVRLVSNDAALRGVSITLAVDRAPLRVCGDGVQLQQVMLNLVINAVDAVARTSSGERRVWVRTARRGGCCEIAVEDTGEGIAEGDIERVFEPFYSTKPDGLGVGLSISRMLVEAHGGRLQASRSPGGGAIFWCTLPPAEGQGGPR